MTRDDVCPGSGLPPGPPEPPIIGQALRLRKDIFGLMREAAGYGDVSTISVKPITLCLVNHPDLNREFLVVNHKNIGRGEYAFKPLRWLWGNSVTTSTDPLHRRQRRLIQPQFHPRHVRNFGEYMTEFSSRQDQDWRDGAKLDVEREMRALTLRIIAKSLFGVELPEAVNRMGAAFNACHEYVYLRLTQPPFMLSFLHAVPLLSTLRFRRNRSLLDGMIYRMIEERRAAGAYGADLLSLLMQARYENEDGSEGSPMSDGELRDEVVSLYSAGHDTTALALTWSFYLLAKHPEIQARFHAEVDEVLDGRPATLEDLPDLRFTERIIYETLRLYPPFWILGRTVYQPIRIGGYEIPPQVNVLTSPLITQRDARWFEEPEEFRPDRWTDDFRKNLHPLAFFPFGAGPHKCLGQGFAWMEAQIALATLGQRWRFSHPAGREAVMLPHFTLVPKGGMPITAERRGRK